jgi:hypothetical protein
MCFRSLSSSLKRKKEQSMGEIAKNTSFFMILLYIEGE